MGIMKEEELLEWIDKRIEDASVEIQCLSLTAQQFPLSDEANHVWNCSIRAINVLNDLKRVVINWYQAGKAVKEG